MYTYKKDAKQEVLRSEFHHMMLDVASSTSTPHTINYFTDGEAGTASMGSSNKNKLKLKTPSSTQTDGEAIGAVIADSTTSQPEKSIKI